MNSMLIWSATSYEAEPQAMPSANNVMHHSNENRGGGRSRGNKRGRGHDFGCGSSSSGGKLTCQVCGKYGHNALRCYHRFDHNYQSKEAVRFAAATNSYKIDQNWYVDTGATDHLTNDLDSLSVKERYRGGDQVQVANGTSLHISHIGHSSITGRSSPLSICNTLNVPQISKHLLSVHKFTSDNDVFFEFHPNSLCVKDRTMKRVLLRGPCDRELYPLHARHQHSSCSFSTVKISSD